MYSDSKSKLMLGKPVCPKCGGKQILFKRTTRSLWCRVCGTEFDKRGHVVEERGK